MLPSWIISTIDGDIDKIPTNEFGLVFAGGIIVMMGGVISALIVGMILESKQLYANVVADSYVQADGTDDAEFWKGLSDEEEKKAREIIQRMKLQQQQTQSQEQSPQPQNEVSLINQSPTMLVSAPTIIQVTTDNENQPQQLSSGVVTSRKSTSSPSSSSSNAKNIFSDY
jgi:hypothetical protein